MIYSFNHFIFWNSLSNLTKLSNPYIFAKNGVKLSHATTILRYISSTTSEAEFKEFERRFKFKPRFKYGWFHLKLYQMFQDLSRRLI